MNKCRWNVAPHLHTSFLRCSASSVRRAGARPLPTLDMRACAGSVHDAARSRCFPSEMLVDSTGPKPLPTLDGTSSSGGHSSVPSGAGGQHAHLVAAKTAAACACPLEAPDRGMHQRAREHGACTNRSISERWNRNAESARGSVQSAERRAAPETRLAMSSRPRTARARLSASPPRKLVCSERVPAGWCPRLPSSPRPFRRRQRSPDIYDARVSKAAAATAAAVQPDPGVTCRAWRSKVRREERRLRRKAAQAIQTGAVTPGPDRGDAAYWLYHGRTSPDAPAPSDAGAWNLVSREQARATAEELWSRGRVAADAGSELCHGRFCMIQGALQIFLVPQNVQRRPRRPQRAGDGVTPEDEVSAGILPVLCRNAMRSTASSRHDRTRRSSTRDAPERTRCSSTHAHYVQRDGELDGIDVACAGASQRSKPSTRKPHLRSTDQPGASRAALT